MSESSAEGDEQESLFQRAWTTAIRPVHIATSRPAIKAYLSTLLFLVFSFVLLSISTTAYAAFYYNYIPQINLERPIYLQYEHTPGSHPQATTNLDTSALISQQPYDVEVVLHMPRTPGNLDAGNFMIDLLLFGPDPITNAANSKLPGSISSLILNLTTSGSVQAHSRRPAILPYMSPILNLANVAVHLPFHLSGFRDLDTAVITVPMFELLSFSRGSRNIPTHARLQIQSTATLQVYSVNLAFRARFHGMRYVIYNHRILSFVAFSAVFYTTSILSMGIAWAVISTALSSSSRKQEQQNKIKAEAKDIRENGRIKSEPETVDAKGKGVKVKTEDGNNDDDDASSGQGLSLSNISDSATQFPTGRGQMPLRYAGRESPGTNQAVWPGSAEGPATGHEDATAAAADDEEEEDDDDEKSGQNPRDDFRGRRFEGDSGIGTSMESENTQAQTTSGLLRRRSSGGAAGRRGVSSGR